MNKFIKLLKRITGVDKQEKINKAYDEFTSIADPYEDWNKDLIVKTFNLDFNVTLSDCEKLGREYIARVFADKDIKERYDSLYKELCECEDLERCNNVYHVDGQYWFINKYMNRKISKDNDGNIEKNEDGGIKFVDTELTIDVSVMERVIGEVPEYKENALNVKIEEFIDLYKNRDINDDMKKNVLTSYISYLYKEHRDYLSIDYERKLANFNTDLYDSNITYSIKKINVYGTVILDGHILEMEIDKYHTHIQYKIYLRNKRKANNLVKETD